MSNIGFTANAGSSEGLSNYEIAVENGFVGTEQDYIDSLQGADGPVGPQGLQGDPGPQGIQGLQGDAGTDGQDGDQGPIGLTGDIGATGPQGPIGATGPQGDVGPIGPIGIPGLPGTDGVDGTNGTDGVDGQDGATGPTGLTGPEGPNGSIDILTDVDTTTVAPSTALPILIWDGTNYVPGSIPATEYDLSYSGRQHTQTSTWEGPNNTHGFNGEQLSGNYGTSTPVDPARTFMGVPVPFDSILKKVIMTYRRNNNLSVDLEHQVVAQRKADLTNTVTNISVTSPSGSFTVADTTNRIITIDNLNISLQQNDQLAVLWRRTDGFGDLQYLYITYLFILEKV